MRLSDKQMASIFGSIQRIEEGELNKLSAFNTLDQKEANISKSSYFALVDKVLILKRLKALDVDNNVIEDIAQQMGMYYIWKVYNQ